MTSCSHDSLGLLGQLKTDLSQNIARRECKTFIIMSLFHNHSIVSAQLNQQVNSIIKNELRRIVSEERNTNLNFIRCLLRKAVKNNDISVPNLSQSFFPDKRTILNCIAKYSFERRKNKIDLEAISSRVDEWAKDANLFYRPFRKLGAIIEPLLFCYQSNWQKDVASTYGTIILMDPTYRTTKYSLPLFLLVTKTNVNFTPIGFFVVQNEDTRSIAEALRIFRKWNPEWKPHYFMVDYSEAEMNAINTVFQAPNNVQIKVCSFHREQAWERWMKKAGNLANKDDREVILRLWRAVAKSQDLHSFEESLSVLQNSEEFLRNEKAREYFEKTWLKVRELWVIAFLDQNFLLSLTTNNGIESQNELLKHSFLKNHKDKSLSNILEVIIEDYIPSTLHTFEIANMELSGSYRNYDLEVPIFLQN